MKTKLKEFVQSLKAGGFIVVSDFRKASVKEYLSPDEQASVALELARSNQEFAQKNDEIKQVATQMKSELKSIEAKVELNSGLLVNGYRMVYKPVVVVADFKRRVRIFLDPETGEEVGTEPLMDGDFQMRMDQVAPEPEPEPAPAEPVPLQQAHDGVVKVGPDDVDGPIEAEFSVGDPE